MTIASTYMEYPDQMKISDDYIFLFGKSGDCGDAHFLKLDYAGNIIVHKNYGEVCGGIYGWMVYDENKFYTNVSEGEWGNIDSYIGVYDESGNQIQTYSLDHHHERDAECCGVTEGYSSFDNTFLYIYKGSQGPVLEDYGLKKIDLQDNVVWAINVDYIAFLQATSESGLFLMDAEPSRKFVTYDHEGNRLGSFIYPYNRSRSEVFFTTDDKIAVIFSNGPEPSSRTFYLFDKYLNIIESFQTDFPHPDAFHQVLFFEKGNSQYFIGYGNDEDRMNLYKLNSGQLTYQRSFDQYHHYLFAAYNATCNKLVLAGFDWSTYEPSLIIDIMSVN